MNFLKKQLSVDIILALVLASIIIYIAIAGFFNLGQADTLNTATVVNVVDLVEDGGVFYQNLEVRLDKKGTFIPLRVQLQDFRLEELKEGDSIYVKQVETSKGNTFTFAGHKRSNIVIWVVILFAIILTILGGSEGLKYIVPSILAFLLVSSGALAFMLSHWNIYIVSICTLGVIAFISILIQVRNIKITLSVTLSQVLTLVIILLINLILFKATFLTEIFYTNINFLDARISLLDFWSVINAAVVYVSFGSTMNTTLDVAMGIINKKLTYPNISAVNLIREGTQQNQIAVARVINSFFFIFLGITLVNIYTSTIAGGQYFWDDPYVVQGLLLFINASLGALLIGPITAIITALFAAAETTDKLKLNLK